MAKARKLAHVNLFQVITQRRMICPTGSHHSPSPSSFSVRGEKRDGMKKPNRKTERKKRDSACCPGHAGAPEGRTLNAVSDRPRPLLLYWLIQTGGRHFECFMCRPTVEGGESLLGQSGLNIRFVHIKCISMCVRDVSFSLCFTHNAQRRIGRADRWS